MTNITLIERRPDMNTPRLRSLRPMTVLIAALFLSLFFGSNSVAFASVGRASATVSRRDGLADPTSVIFVETSGETFADAVSQQATADPDSEPQIAAVLQQMLPEAQAGDDLSLTDSLLTAPEEVDQIETALASLDDPPASSTNTSLHGRVAHARVGIGAARKRASNANPLDTDPDDSGNSDDFPTAGAANASGTAWTIPATDSFIEDRDCEDTCVELDRVSCRWTINPSLTSDAISFKCTYSPDHGNLTNVYADAFTWCDYGMTQCADTYCGKSGAESGMGSGTCLLTHHAVSLNDRIRQGIRLRAYSTVEGSDVYSRLGTGYASCNNIGSRNCIYNS